MINLFNWSWGPFLHTLYIWTESNNNNHFILIFKVEDNGQIETILASFVTSPHSSLQVNYCDQPLQLKLRTYLHTLYIWTESDNSNHFIWIFKVEDCNAVTGKWRRFWPVLWRHYTQVYRSIVVFNLFNWSWGPYLQILYIGTESNKNNYFIWIFKVEDNG